ncbi:FlgB family protein [Frigidibacter sp. SD6-1]|uniref:FlgB family protein n=1 Tax=Frigidibacter sp. SD6-1 TaxID=3032581 RepID=UPI0024E0208F|nr:FlgB family protein [Frigidibacter sp. SD6-1]
MFESPEVMGMASALARNAGVRLGAIAENVANADTPGYRAKDGKPFADVYGAGPGLSLRATRPGHVQGAAGESLTAISDRAGGHMSPNGNNVSLEGEMVAAADVRRDHDLALTIYKTSLGILRASLGRR